MTWYNTSGTRDKSIFLNAENESFYFKTSYKKGQKDYVYEFWSEIVASLLGESINLPVLHYDIASYEDKIGCISKNMLKFDKEELVEGVNLVLEIDSKFRDTCKKDHPISKIISSLKNKGVIEYKRILVEMILFDCIIGNTDRHSENWGLIKNIESAFVFENLSLWNKFKLYYTIRKEFGFSFRKIKELCAFSTYKFAPFYDNGSSLGRELNNDRISNMLENDTAFESYLYGGKCDIKLRQEKTTFNETIEILFCDYPKECNHFVSKHLILYNKNKFSALINNIDYNFPNSKFEYARLSQQRKDFFVKLIDSRISQIKKNYYDKI